MILTRTIFLLWGLLVASCTDFDTSYDLAAYDLQLTFEEDQYETLDGRWVRTGQNGVQLLTSRDGDPWRGQWNAWDEPEPGYCGPTAMRNMLWWYNDGLDVSYDHAAAMMDLDDWRLEDKQDTIWACSGACMAEPLCVAGCYLVIKKQLSGLGVTAKGAVKALKRWAPEGYEAHVTKDDPSAIVELVEQLLDGNPVVISEYIEGNLHLSILTGISVDDTGVPWVVMANSYERTLDEFMRAWSLRDFGDSKTVKRAARRRVGIAPFMAVWWEVE